MAIYDEVEIDDMTYVQDIQTFFYDCPCGDQFRITLDELQSGYNIAECPSCTLQIRIIYTKDDLGNFGQMSSGVPIEL